MRQLVKEAAHLPRVANIPDDRAPCCWVLEAAQAEGQLRSDPANGGALPPGAS